MKIKTPGVLAFIGYILSIVLANWMTVYFGLVPIGFGLVVTAGTFAAGAALILRDAVQVTFGKAVSVLAIIVGAAVSYFVADPNIAIASALAFFVSEFVDLLVFTPLRTRRGLPIAVVISSVVSSPVDTVLFLYLAGFSLTWQAVAGQFIVKTILALIVALILAKKKK